MEALFSDRTVCVGAGIVPKISSLGATTWGRWVVRLMKESVKHGDKHSAIVVFSMAVIQFSGRLAPNRVPKKLVDFAETVIAFSQFLTIPGGVAKAIKYTGDARVAVQVRNPALLATSTLSAVYAWNAVILSVGFLTAATLKLAGREEESKKIYSTLKGRWGQGSVGCGMLGDILRVLMMRSATRQLEALDASKRGPLLLSIVEGREVTALGGCVRVCTDKNTLGTLTKAIGASQVLGGSAKAQLFTQVCKVMAKEYAAGKKGIMTKVIQHAVMILAIRKQGTPTHAIIMLLHSFMRLQGVMSTKSRQDEHQKGIRDVTVRSEVEK